MNKEVIGKKLKDNRKSNHLSVKEVSEKFKECRNPVSPKTIYGWESGNTQPDADTLLFLCDLYNIENVLETFGYHLDEGDYITLTDSEKDIIKAYRNHPEMHLAIQRLLKLS